MRDCSECVKNRCKGARVHAPCINIGDDLPMKQAWLNGKSMVGFMKITYLLGPRAHPSGLTSHHAIHNDDEGIRDHYLQYKKRD